MSGTTKLSELSEHAQIILSEAKSLNYNSFRTFMDNNSTLRINKSEYDLISKELSDLANERLVETGTDLFPVAEIPEDMRTESKLNCGLILEKLATYIQEEQNQEAPAAAAARPRSKSLGAQITGYFTKS